MNGTFANVVWATLEEAVQQPQHVLDFTTVEDKPLHEVIDMIRSL